MIKKSPVNKWIKLYMKMKLLKMYKVIGRLIKIKQ